MIKFFATMHPIDRIVVFSVLGFVAITLILAAMGVLH
jgi:hypothetical protein